MERFLAERQSPIRRILFHTLTRSHPKPPTDFARNDKNACPAIAETGVLKRCDIGPAPCTAEPDIDQGIATDAA